MLLMFENEELYKFFKSKEVGYGDKLEKLVGLLGDSRISIINRIKDANNLTRSSLEFLTAVVRIINGAGELPVSKDQKHVWRSMLPITPPTVKQGELNFDYDGLANLTSDGLYNELCNLVERVGIVHTGYILEKLQCITDGNNNEIEGTMV